MSFDDISIVERYLQSADDFFESTLEGIEWEKEDESMRKRAVGQALVDIQSFRYRIPLMITVNTPTPVFQAVAIQALFLLKNLDRTQYMEYADNGIQSIDVAETKITQGKPQVVCQRARILLKPYMLRSARLS